MGTGNEDAMVIEAAVTPYRPVEPLHTTDGTTHAATVCLDAGAGIIDHDYEMHRDRPEAVDEMITTADAIRSRHPDALIDSDYLGGRFGRQAHEQVGQP